jgi:hypothetical protein
MRIFKHLRSDWFKYGFETIAVVVGILAAFALENWNEERQAQNQALSFLHHIATDIDEDIEELGSLMIYVDRSIERAESLITSFKQRSFNDQEATNYIAWLNVEKGFQVNRSGMDALINSGRLDLLSPDITYALQQYYALCDKLADREAISNGFIQNKYETYHYEHYVESTRLSDVYGIPEKYADDPREKYMISEEDLVDDFKLEILILIRLVHSETEKELYQQLIDSAEQLKISIGQILSL